jgi:hypothetical protein
MVEVEEMDFDFVDLEDSFTPVDFAIVKDGDNLDGVCRRLSALVLS